VATFGVGERFVTRSQQLNSPALVDKMVRRSISRREVAAVLVANEVFEHDSRVRYVLWARWRGGRFMSPSQRTTSWMRQS
jgi:hypothetical protein